MDVPRPPRKKTKRYVTGVAVAVGIGAATLALAKLEPAAPSVDRATIWVDTVQRGEMLRQVRGPGTLVPEFIQWIPATTAGRIERILVQPGEQVDANTVLMQMTNPDVQLEVLEAERQLAGAAAELVNLEATLRTQTLNQQGVVAALRSEYQDAVRTAKANEEMARRQLISEMELERARDRAEELTERLRIEQERLAVMERAVDSQLEVQRAQVARLESIVAFNRGRVESMNVRAGTDGVVAEINFQPGQWVNPGQTLSRVVKPGRLKAVLRIPEVQAKDVAIGQTAAIDTRNGIASGRVVRIDPAVQNGAVNVDVSLQGELPQGARPDLSVDGTIEIERLGDVLYVGRPAYGQAESTVGLFKLLPSGDEAVRVPVRLGKSSVNTVEIVDGLESGDGVILSDLSAYDAVDRIRLK